MRNPERIPVILDALLECWLKHPDQRLMQLLDNVTHPMLQFYTEDDVLLELIEKYPRGVD